MLNLARCLREHRAQFIVVVNSDDTARAILRAAGIPFREAPLSDVETDWETPIIRECGIKIWIDDRLNTEWQHARRVEAAGARRVSFDDRGSGAEYADLNIAALAFLDGRAVMGRRTLTGIEHLILNDDIRRHRRVRRESLAWILTLGGTDTWGVTPRLVQIVAQRDLRVTVVLGPGFRHHRELEKIIPSDFNVRRNVPSLIEEFARHDVAITGGGITAFESCACGLPTIVVANEPFETPVGMYLATLGCARFAGHHSNIDEAAILAPIDPETMSTAGLTRVPIDGVERVCAEIMALA